MYLGALHMHRKQALGILKVNHTYNWNQIQTFESSIAGIVTFLEKGPDITEPKGRLQELGEGLKTRKS
jgi:hypothetical protein